jgi:hypothetical protein
MVYVNGVEVETPELSGNDKEAGIKIIAALGTQGMEVTKWEWRYVPREQQWQLFLKTSRIESHGREVARKALNDALVNGGISDDVASRVRLEMA